MVQSLTVIERKNPPPRRKACTACIRAKRRCDLGLPACQRCALRKVACSYPSRGQPRTRGLPRSPSPEETSNKDTPKAANEDAQQEGVSGSSSELMQLPTADLEACLRQPDPSIHGNHYPLNWDASTLDPFSVDLDTFDTLFDPVSASLGDLIAEDTSSSLVPRFPLPVFPMRSGPGTTEFKLSIIPQRLQYSIDELIREPRRMVTENATPWCHPQLYRDEMPRAMQDAQACCGLYMAKNPVNAIAVMRTIESRVQDLTNTPLSIMASPFEALARTQALLLYQIIRLFDGDVSARASAERTMPDLEEAASRLRQYIPIDEGDLVSYQGQQILDGSHPATAIENAAWSLSTARDFWNSWIFQESARRTFVMAFFLSQLYARLRNQTPVICDARLSNCYSWTASAAKLWRASDAVDFTLAWRKQKHNLVTIAGLINVVPDAEADDFDTYDRMILTTVFGIEETKSWFFSKGGAL